MTARPFNKFLNYTKTSMREVLGAEVKLVREATGMTQLRCARFVGSHENAITAAETGSTPISPERIIAILLLLDVEPKRIAELIAYALS